MSVRVGTPLYLYDRGGRTEAERIATELEDRIHAAGGDRRYQVDVVPVHNDGPWYTDGYVVILNDYKPHAGHLTVAESVIRQSELGEL